MAVTKILAKEQTPQRGQTPQTIQKILLNIYHLSFQSQKLFQKEKILQIKEYTCFCGGWSDKTLR